MITMKGIRLPSLDIRRNAEKGTYEISGYYELVSSNDTILAKQAFNGYNDIKLSPSPESSNLIHKLMVSLNNDMEKILGFVE